MAASKAAKRTARPVPATWCTNRIRPPIVADGAEFGRCLYTAGVNLASSLVQTTQLDMLPRMSITVIITRDDNGAPLTREIYEEGARFKVENGELNIISGSPELVALYGSGNWLSVHMDDHVAVVTTKPPEDDSGSGDMDFGLGDLDSSDSDDDTDTSTDDVDTESTDLDADSTESDTETVESDDADPTE